MTSPPTVHENVHESDHISAETTTTTTAEGQREPPDKRTRGAPLRNSNAVKHGLTAGRLPSDCTYIVKQIFKYRRMVEQRALESFDEIDVITAGIIQTACEWLKYGLQARHWLRISYDDLSPEQRLHFSKEAARGFSERDRHLRLLGLENRANTDPWSVIDSPAKDVTEPHDDVDSDDATPSDDPEHAKPMGATAEPTDVDSGDPNP